jgi:hypothetical protein
MDAALAITLVCELPLVLPWPHVSALYLLPLVVLLQLLVLLPSLVLILATTNHCTADTLSISTGVEGRVPLVLAMALMLLLAAHADVIYAQRLAGTTPATNPMTL